MKFEKKETGDPKKPDHLVLLQHGETMLVLGDLVRTTYESEVGDIQCWRFVGISGGGFMRVSLRDAKEKLALRLMGFISDGLKAKYAKDRPDAHDEGRAGEVAEITSAG